MLHRPTFAGVFETHITVALPVDHGRFQNDCLLLGVKPIVIVLPAGITPVQPMTSAVYHGDLPAVLVKSQDLVRQLQSLGYVPVRLKIEAGPENADLPETDAVASDLPQEFYFEHHVKAVVSGAAEHDRLRTLCADFDAHVSANALKELPNKDREVFVTLRNYAVGRGTAAARLRALVEALSSAHIRVLKSITEFCVYDSNIEIDDGWK